MAHDFSNPNGVRQALKNGLKFIEPPEDLLPSEFAERELRISAGNAIPGPVRFRNAPHQVEPLNLIDDPTCERITLMWGAQTGKTQVAMMAKAFFIGHKPSNMMAMQPSQSDLNTWLNGKFNPMVESSPILAERVAKARAREGTNNQNMKTYPGGALMFAWAGSPKTMRGRSAPKIFPDEIDGYDKTKEGDAVGLLWQRAATFRDQRLLFETSTPTHKDTSNIEPAFLDGDQRRFHAPCLDCGEYQHLKWGQVTWQKDEAGDHLPDTAQYTCEHCGSLWDDTKRSESLGKAKWIAEKPFSGHASFHLPEIASKFVRLADVVKSFLTKKKKGDLQSFVNISLAETWEEEGATLESDHLYLRREHYAAEVPSKFMVVTAAVDVQDDRLEIQVEAWGEGETNAKIDFDILRGDPSKKEIWDRLDERLSRKYTHESGVELPIACSTIDSGGHYTQQVYNFVKSREVRRIYAIKGSSTAGAAIVGRPTRSNKGRINLFGVGTDTAKELIFKRLQITEVGDGYIHFPILEQFDKEWFEQLTSEKCVTRYREGRAYRKWIKTRPRNEALDLSVYNLAALYILNPVFKVLAKQFNIEPEKEVIQTSAEKALTPVIEKPIKRKRKQKRGGFATTW